MPPKPPVKKPVKKTPKVKVQVRGEPAKVSANKLKKPSMKTIMGADILKMPGMPPHEMKKTGPFSSGTKPVKKKPRRR